MPARVNLRLLERGPQHLEGILAIEEFSAGFTDDLVSFAAPLAYDLQVSRESAGLLVRGTLSTQLDCKCSRCLKSFSIPLDIKEMEAIVPLEGEEVPPRDGDFVDLTPLLREDTFLALPTKPLCKPECRGLARKASARDLCLGTPPGDGAMPWSELDKLKL